MKGVTSRYGSRRGSVSGSFKAYRFEFTRTNVINGLTNEREAAVIHARTGAEADRKFQKKYGSLPSLTILKTWCLDEKE